MILWAMVDLSSGGVSTSVGSILLTGKGKDGVTVVAVVVRLAGVLFKVTIVGE
jgi:hypothetical protein